ncbi:HU family DNA-binding protein [Geobacter sp. SVR]
MSRPLTRTRCKGRNPQTGAATEIPASTKMGFKAAQ